MRIKIINEGLIKNKSNLIVESKVIFPSQIINYTEKKELEKMTMMCHSDINIDTIEYEHCHIVRDFDFTKNRKSSIEWSE